MLLSQKREGFSSYVLGESNKNLRVVSCVLSKKKKRRRSSKKRGRGRFDFTATRSARADREKRKAEKVRKKIWSRNQGGSIEGEGEQPTTEGSVRLS